MHHMLLSDHSHLAAADPGSSTWTHLSLAWSPASFWSTRRRSAMSLCLKGLILARDSTHPFCTAQLTPCMQHAVFAQRYWYKHILLPESCLPPSSKLPIPSCSTTRGPCCPEAHQESFYQVGCPKTSVILPKTSARARQQCRTTRHDLSFKVGDPVL